MYGGPMRHAIAEALTRQQITRYGVVGTRKAVNGVLWLPKAPALMILALAVLGIFANLISPYDPIAGQLRHRLLPPAWVDRPLCEAGINAISGTCRPEGVTGSDYLLGTDALGRDILSRMIHGARISLTVSIVAIFFGNIVGTSIGLYSGFKGGWIDAILMRIVDIAIALPNLLLAILLVALFGASLQNVILVIAINLWTRSARQVRAVTLSTKEEDFVNLARVAGASQWRIMALHVFPNTIPVLLVLMTLEIGGVILFESSLSFLGVGLPPPAPSWGVMVADGRGLLASAWWISLVPGIAIAITVTGFNLFGDWLRDRLDPTLSQSR